MESTYTSPFRIGAFDDWRRIIRQEFLPTECFRDRPGAFDCIVTARRCGAATLAELELPPHRIQRTAQLVARTDAPFFKVSWQVSGETDFEQDRRRMRLRPGSWAIYDTSKPYTVDVRERSRYIVLMVPKTDAFGWQSDAEALFGTPLLTQGASHAALSAIATLLRDGAILDETTQAVVQNSVTALIKAGLRAAGDAPAMPNLGRAKLASIEDYIDANLHDSNLRPDMLAQAAGVSRRSLYNLFHLIGETPHSYVQMKRIRRAQQLLLDPRQADRGVTAIAYEVGFADPAHFSRLFREHVGTSPSDWRLQSNSAKAVAGQEQSLEPRCTMSVAAFANSG